MEKSGWKLIRDSPMSNVIDNVLTLLKFNYYLYSKLN